MKFLNQFQQKNRNSLSMKYYNKGYKNNNGTLAIKEIFKNAKQYGLIYKKGRKKI